MVTLNFVCAGLVSLDRAMVAVFAGRMICKCVVLFGLIQKKVGGKESE